MSGHGIRPGDRVEKISNPALDSRQVVAVAADTITLDLLGHRVTVDAADYRVCRTATASREGALRAAAHEITQWVRSSCDLDETCEHPIPCRVMEPLALLLTDLANDTDTYTSSAAVGLAILEGYTR